MYSYDRTLLGKDNDDNNSLTKKPGVYPGSGLRRGFLFSRFLVGYSVIGHISLLALGRSNCRTFSFSCQARMIMCPPLFLVHKSSVLPIVLFPKNKKINIQCFDLPLVAEMHRFQCGFDLIQINSNHVLTKILKNQIQIKH